MSWQSGRCSGRKHSIRARAVRRSSRWARKSVAATDGETRSIPRGDAGAPAHPVSDRRFAGPASERTMERLRVREAESERDFLDGRLPIVEVGERQLASDVVDLLREAGALDLEPPAHRATAHVQEPRHTRDRRASRVLKLVLDQTADARLEGAGCRKVAKQRFDARAV